MIEMEVPCTTTTSLLKKTALPLDLVTVAALSKHITKDSKRQFPRLDHFEKVNFKYSNMPTSCEKFKYNKFQETPPTARLKNYY